jgi:UDP-galactopyranose mutase
VTGHGVVVFSRDVKHLFSLLIGCDISKYKRFIDGFASHGTTSVMCEIDDNPYSWIYLPTHQYQYSSHHIICTGNFASSNNVEGRNTGVVEFTNFLHKNVILNELKKVLLSPKYLAHQKCRNVYENQSVVYPVLEGVFLCSKNKQNSLRMRMVWDMED